MSKISNAVPVAAMLVCVLVAMLCFALLAAEQDAAYYKRLYDNATDHYKSENQRAEWLLDRYYMAKNLLNSHQRAEFNRRRDAQEAKPSRPR